MTALDRISVCQGGEEPYELHVRYCVPLAEQLGAVSERLDAVLAELSKPVDHPATHYRDGLRDAARQVGAALEGEQQ